MKFFVGLAAGAALAAGAWYALKDPAMREAVEGVRGDLEARDYASLQARLDSGLAEVRRQVEERFGPQTDWSTEVVEGEATLVTESDAPQAEVAPQAAAAPAPETPETPEAPEAEAAPAPEAPAAGA